MGFVLTRPKNKFEFYGDIFDTLVDQALNGKEAVDMVKQAYEEG